VSVCEPGASTFSDDPPGCAPCESRALGGNDSDRASLYPHQNGAQLPQYEARATVGSATTGKEAVLSEQPLSVEDRKDFVLLLLAARGAKEEAEPVVGVTRLQKYLFLLQSEAKWDKRFAIREPYDFRAYDYGPFDAQLYDDLEFLENAQLIARHEAGPEPAADDEESRQQAYEWGTVSPEVVPWEDDDRIYRYELTDQGRRFVSRYQVNADDWATLTRLKGEWNDRPLQTLLRWLYRKYPGMAENTKLKHLTE
jgi:hypothetical protein